MKLITYTIFVSDIRPKKYEPRRMRLLVGVNRLECDGEKSTETSGLETTKIIVYIVISIPGVRFGLFEISNMYLNTKLPSPKYMKIHVIMIPQEVMEEYDVTQYLDEKGYSYV